MKNKINVGATSSMIRSIRNSNIKPKAAICELIDNSLDAGAKKIHVEYNDMNIMVCDNGSGISPVAMRDVFVLGESYSDGDYSKSGQYGIGLKEGAAGLGGRLELATINENGLEAGSIDWDTQFVIGGEVDLYNDLEKLRIIKPDIMEKWSTVICIGDLGGNARGRLQDTGSWVREIFQSFMACLDTVEISISVRGKDFYSWDEQFRPKIPGGIREKNCSVNGKRFTLRYGLAKEIVDGYTGVVHVHYQHRHVTKWKSVANYPLPQKYVVDIHLADEWKHDLSKHKDSFNGKTALQREVAIQLGSELEEDRNARQDLAIDLAIGQINQEALISVVDFSDEPGENRQIPGVTEIDTHGEDTPPVEKKCPKCKQLVERWPSKNNPCPHCGFVPKEKDRPGNLPPPETGNETAGVGIGDKKCKTRKKRKKKHGSIKLVRFPEPENFRLLQVSHEGQGKDCVVTVTANTAHVFLSDLIRKADSNLFLVIAQALAAYFLTEKGSEAAEYDKKLLRFLENEDKDDAFTNLVSFLFSRMKSITINEDVLEDL